MGPLVRIILRYGVGGIVGYEVGSMLADDPDVISVATVAASGIVGYAIEHFYALAKKRGWRT